MSILIKGMEMPTSCANCELAKHFDGYNENECPFNAFSYYDCPLVPVPPHGRLIDAEALCERLMIAWHTADSEGRRIIGEVMADVVTPIVAGTPTVIAAEEGET